MVWPDDVPPEVASQMQQKPAAPKPKLAAVGQAPAPAESAPEPAAPACPCPRGGDQGGEEGGHPHGWCQDSLGRTEDQERRTEDRRVQR